MTIDRMGTPVFSIALLLPGRVTAPARVDFVAIRARTVSHEVVFTERDALHDAFAAPLAMKVGALLEALPRGGPHEIDGHDDDMSIPGLVLGRLRTSVTAPDILGDRRATLAFSHFVGGVQSAFAALTYFDRPTLEPREELGVRALEDVVTPLLNMASAIRAAPGSIRVELAPQRMDAQLGEIERRAAELEYHAGLLRRYVSECAPERVGFPMRTERADGDGTGRGAWRRCN